MNRSIYQRAGLWLLTLVVVTVTIAPVEAGWRRCRWRRTRCCVTRCCEAKACEPCKLDCVCLLYPIYDGGSFHIYYAEEHAACGEMEPCNEPEPNWHAEIPNQAPDYCDRASGELGACIGASRTYFDPADIRLSAKMPSTLTAHHALLTPGNNVPAIHAEDIKFKTPRGNVVHARTFLMKVDPGAGLPSQVVGFGCEIVDDPTTGDIDVGKPPQQAGNPYLFEVRRGGVTYLVITRD